MPPKLPPIAKIPLDHDEEEINKRKGPPEIEIANILIVCGQGTYENGRFWTEYADRDVYMQHAIEAADVARKFAYNVIVLSGGHTNAERFELTEAGSVVRIWKDTGTLPGDQYLIATDPYSLDSAENIHIGLMCARQKLNSNYPESPNGTYVPIRRVGVYAAWSFKKKRFDRAAKELGILDHFYFHGLAEAPRAEEGQRAMEGEEKWLAEAEPRDSSGAVVTDRVDFLMIRIGREKRWARFTGNPKHPDFITRSALYSSRLAELRGAFPDMFDALESLRGRRDPQTLGALSKAMKETIISP